ncbi:sugar transporter [Salipiger abyssi]|uniref:Capsular polysaccharide transport system permease protein n=1 Tax=Salipiger abyssi TaxID=1250539 RepID=A0A1P8V0J2_9RHOB|nr:sugar transporter [Salipiger abyssi]APZ55172.1 capsular polysaccharide transport system permease protein [Salipiger abyssi]
MSTAAPAAQPANKPATLAGQIPKNARKARPQKRHYGVLASFVLVVVLPLTLAIFYLFAIAEDQYATSFGFAVRSEETTLANSLLGGLSSLSGGSSSSDSDILYEFIQSRTLVEKVDERLDLTSIFSRPEYDPYFSYDPEGSFEDLVAYWQRMVHVSYASSGTGLLEVTIKAFTPGDALAIAEAIVSESTVMINELSTIARADATRYAREDLDQAVTQLKTAREALTRFRSVNRIIDPSADLQGQLGLLNSLEAKLAEVIIELNVQLETARENDPRVVQLRNRIPVINKLIEEERRKFGLGGTMGGDTSAPAIEGARDYSTIVGEFERLTVDLEYAEERYLATQAALDAAQAEAQRQSRYLATYMQPSLPASSQYPERGELLLIATTILLLSWAVGVLIYYSLRDRR